MFALWSIDGEMIEKLGECSTIKFALAILIGLLIEFEF
jgi:hypothetical protein